ncbi:unnamed protein product, partial [Polarella glacialis]
MLGWQELGTSTLSEQYAQNWAAVQAHQELIQGSLVEEADPSLGCDVPASSKGKDLSPETLQAADVLGTGIDGAGTGGTFLRASGAATNASNSPGSENPHATPSRRAASCQPLQICNWTVDHVNAWLDCTPLPAEVIATLKANAINGPVLESLTEQDLQAIGLDKFGWRRQILLSRKELVELLDSKLRPPEWAECFELSSVVVSRENSPNRTGADVAGLRGEISPRRFGTNLSASSAGALPPGASMRTLFGRPRSGLSASGSTSRTVVIPPPTRTLGITTHTRWRSPVMPRNGSYLATAGMVSPQQHQ